MHQIWVIKCFIIVQWSECCWCSRCHIHSHFQVCRRVQAEQFSFLFEKREEVASVVILAQSWLLVEAALSYSEEDDKVLTLHAMQMCWGKYTHAIVTFPDSPGYFATLWDLRLGWRPSLLGWRPYIFALQTQAIRHVEAVEWVNTKSTSVHWRSRTWLGSKAGKVALIWTSHPQLCSRIWCVCAYIYIYIHILYIYIYYIQ